MTAADGGTLDAMIEVQDLRLLRLTADEQQALIAALYVVKDNWWLTDLEQRLLARLEDADEVAETEPAAHRTAA